MIEPKAVDRDQDLEDSPSLKTFTNRVVDDRITWTGFHNWSYKFIAEAVDIATGITVMSGKSFSEKSATMRARANLKAILLQKGIIQEDKC